MSSIYNRYPRCHYKEVTKGHFTEKRGLISKEEASLFIENRGLREMKPEDRIAIYKGWKYRH